MPLLVVLQLLAGAGLTAAMVVGLLTGATSRWIRAALRGLLAPGV
ncbi:hypothetical protein [Streptomyces rubiginosohelvolus]